MNKNGYQPKKIDKPPVPPKGGSGVPMVDKYALYPLPTEYEQNLINHKEIISILYSIEGLLENILDKLRY